MSDNQAGHTESQLVDNAVCDIDPIAGVHVLAQETVSDL